MPEQPAANNVLPVPRALETEMAGTLSAGAVARVPAEPRSAAHRGNCSQRKPTRPPHPSRDGTPSPPLSGPNSPARHRGRLRRPGAQQRGRTGRSRGGRAQHAVQRHRPGLTARSISCMPGAGRGRGAASGGGPLRSPPPRVPGPLRYPGRPLRRSHADAGSAALPFRITAVSAALPRRAARPSGTGPLRSPLPSAARCRTDPLSAARHGGRRRPDRAPPRALMCPDLRKRAEIP